MPDLHPADARAIFFDWALGLPPGADAAAAAARLLAHHRPPEEHPMAGLLREATQAQASGRRGRRRRGAPEGG